jgi:hypothetical protein
MAVFGVVLLIAGMLLFSLARRHSPSRNSSRQFTPQRL